MKRYNKLDTRKIAMDINDILNTNDTSESAIFRPFHGIFFKEAIKSFNRISDEDDNLVIVTFVLFMIAFEQYIKSKIFKEYRNHSGLLNDNKYSNKGKICSEFYNRVRNKYTSKVFTHFDQPFELFKKYSTELRLKGLINWLLELNNLHSYSKMSDLINYVELRNLFIHYWEYPLDAQFTDENGNSKNINNIFENKIKSMTKTHLLTVKSDILEFIKYIGDQEDKELINQLI